MGSFDMLRPRSKSAFWVMLAIACAGLSVPLAASPKEDGAEAEDVSSVSARDVEETDEASEEARAAAPKASVRLARLGRGARRPWARLRIEEQESRKSAEQPGEAAEVPPAADEAPAAADERGAADTTDMGGSDGADGATAAAAPPADPAADDYYTRRASEILEKDKKLDSPPPHPLAAAYPEHFVVVCEAGCPGRTATIVFMEPMAARGPADGGEMIPTSSTGATGETALDAAALICAAGCYYDTPRAYRAVGSGDEGIDLSAATITTTGENVPAVASGASGLGGAKGAGAKRSGNGGSGDWLKSINRERETGKAN